MTATAGNISAVSGLRLCQLPFTPTDKTGKAQQHPHIYAKESILPERNGYPSVLAGFLFPLRPFISQCDATPHPKPRCPRLPDTISAPSLCQMSHGPASGHTCSTLSFPAIAKRRPRPSFQPPGQVVNPQRCKHSTSQPFSTTPPLRHCQQWHEKTKVLTVFSKVRIEFSKVPTVFPKVLCVFGKSTPA